MIDITQEIHDSKKTKNTTDLTEISVSKYYPLVIKIARHISFKMPANIQLDDLIQAGMVGLLEACKKFDKDKGASFETFAGIRIRGAMLDDIRRGDWGPRSIYRNNRKIHDATKKVEAIKGRYARSHEVASEMQVSINEYFDILRDIKGCRLYSYEEMFESEEFKIPSSVALLAPDLQIVDEKFQNELDHAIEQLPEKERIVLILYYKKEFNLKQIGQRLGVSESRVSQIHSQAANKLRDILKHWA